MKRKFTPEELFAYVLLIAFSILVLAFTFRIAYKERDYLASGESIDLNEYIRNIRLYNNELPMDQVCTLRVDRCYGLFYSYTTPGGYRHRSTTTYYYVIGLEDGSVMVINTSELDNTEFDRMAGYTLSGQDANVMVYTGYVQKLNDGLREYYDSHVNYLKEQGYLDSDAEVRYVSMSNAGSRGFNVFLIFLMLSLVLISILMCVEIRKKSVEERQYERAEKRYPITKKDVVKWIVIYIISFPLMYGFLYMYSYGDVRNTNKYLDLYITLAITPIIPTAWLLIDRKDQMAVPGLGVVHMNSPAMKKLEEFAKGLEKNGYSEAMMNTADEVIKAYKDGQPVDMFVFKEYILDAADYCNMQGRYDAALSYLDIIHSRQLMEQEVYSHDKGLSAFVYWASKFEAYRGLGDVEAAEKLFHEAGRYWDNIYMLNDDKKFWKDVSLCHYYILKNDLEEASKCADRLYMYKTIETENVAAYLLNAEIYKLKGDTEGAAVMMGFAREKAEKGAIPLKQWYEAAKERMWNE